jgi:hypothetical protein
MQILSKNKSRTVTANEDNVAFLGIVTISACFHKVGKCCLENTYTEGVSKFSTKKTK